MKNVHSKISGVGNQLLNFGNRGIKQLLKDVHIGFTGGKCTMIDYAINGHYLICGTKRLFHLQVALP